MRSKHPPSSFPEARHKDYIKHRATNIARAKRYREVHPEVKRNSLRRVYRRLKDAAFKAYGDKCSCCGCSTREFLALHHKNGGGSKERKSGLAGMAFLYWLRENGYPADIGILCHNCNVALGAYGYCPHQAEGFVEM